MKCGNGQGGNKTYNDQELQQRETGTTMSPVCAYLNEIFHFQLKTKVGFANVLLGARA